MRLWVYEIKYIMKETSRELSHEPGEFKKKKKDYKYLRWAAYKVYVRILATKLQQHYSSDKYIIKCQKRITELWL